jgi:hypothetical protein
MIGAFALGGFVLLPFAIKVIPQPFGVFALFVWVGGFAAAFLSLRCPHCGESATASESGLFVTPFVGNNCRRCGKPY